MRDPNQPILLGISLMGAIALGSAVVAAIAWHQLAVANADKLYCQEYLSDCEHQLDVCQAMQVRVLMEVKDVGEALHEQKSCLRATR